MSADPLLSAIVASGFVPLGWFTPEAGDGLPGDARFVVLIGNAGPAMFARFEAERGGGETLDAWTRRAAGTLAGTLGAGVVHPFDTPPLPFLAWARRGGGGHVSPLGLNIHARYGLWHAYRAALLFAEPRDLPPAHAGPHPCEICAGKPCLSTCPAGAFSATGYDVPACVAHLETPAGADCMAEGCRARRACPVGREAVYAPAQAGFHMRAFLAARQGHGQTPGNPRSSRPRVF